MQDADQIEGLSVTYAVQKDGTFTETVPELTNAGKYTVYYRVSAPGYETQADSFTVTVQKAMPTIYVPQQATEFTYTGERQYFDGTGVTWSSREDGADLAIESFSFVTVAEGNGKQIKITSTETANYLSAEITVTLTVRKAQFTLPQPETQSYVYTGSAQGVPISVTALGDDQFTVWYNGGTTVAQFTDAGSYEVTVRVDGNDNYEVASTEYCVEIAKAPHNEIDVSGVNTQYVWDGQSITVSGEVILCLNGQKLDLKGQHISVGSGASFTLCDCSTGGVLTGGSGSNGGGVYVGGGGTFTMTGGSIAGNTANAGGGVYVDEGGTFTMEDGSINNNQATSGGGGGVMVNEGSFTLSGGSIIGNTTNSDTFGYGGGVCLYGTFNLSGDAIIQNNTKDGTADNLYLGWNTINITGPLGENARIGVTAEGIPRSFISGWSDNMAGENPADYFSSDGDALGIGLNADGNVVLGSLCTTITLDPNGGTLPEYSLVAGAALPIPTKTGYTFAGWYENQKFSGDPVKDVPTDSTENLNFYAKWTANTYTITFYDEDGTTVLQSGNVEYGKEPEYSSETPTKASTAEYDYTFAGWTPAITAVTGEATYKATYTATKRSYTITVQVANGCEDMGEVSGGGTFEYGTTVPLSATAKSGYQFVKWEEDGETSATREITVTDNAIYTAQFEIFYPVSNITLDKTELSLSIGDSETLTATIEPGDATNKTVTWSSDKPGVAAVDASGNVTAVAAGNATITAMADGGKTATCVVQVREYVEVEASGSTNLSFTTDRDKFTLTAVVKAEGNVLTPTENSWKWSVANEDVVERVTLRSKAVSYSTSRQAFTIKGTGTTTITATYDDGTYRGLVEFKVSISKPTPPDPISYYNIYVEDVCDGVEVTTSKNVVREGGSVSVYVKKDTANYTFDNFHVYYKEGYYDSWDELKEGTQPGEYPIKNIWTHIYIKAEGAEEKEDPTGIESIEGVKVYTKDGSLYVQTPQREQVIIVSMSGAVVKNEEQIGLKQYHGLQPGIYIVRIGDRAYKLRLN